MSAINRRDFHKVTAAGLGSALTSLGPDVKGAEFTGQFPPGVERVWIGPDFWANRLQDWRLRDGRLECVAGRADLPMRTVHLLTRRLGKGEGEFKLSVRLGRIGGQADDAAAGFLIGAGGEQMDYRSAALIHHTPGRGGGLFVGINGTGKNYLSHFSAFPEQKMGEGTGKGLPQEVSLVLDGKVTEQQSYFTLNAYDLQSGQRVSTFGFSEANNNPFWSVGNIALVSHPGTGKNPSRFWFKDWTLSGSKIEEHADRALGPILCTQYTVHSGILKLTAQLTPVGPQDGKMATLQIKRGGDWQTVGTAEVVVPGYTATFRVESWDPSRDVPFRVVYEYAGPDGKLRAAEWPGTIKRDPTDRETFILAALSCVQQVQGSVSNSKAAYDWTKNVNFPHADMVPNVAKHKADLFFFAGDQIYEGNPTRPVREPLDESLLDYLYKWYLWCWAYGDLVRDTPCICIPDDHDVYHGNIWGMGGKAAREGDPSGLAGGYGMPPVWLNMMQRTQTSHLPDPFDQTPVEQGIGVYYTSLVWGGIGFAILEDRKFKSSPTLVKARMTLDSHILDYDYDTRKADVPGATLLGDRQLKFLRQFAGDWRSQVMKAALSQTIFCNLQINSRGETAGKLDRDLDSNGWPQTGRTLALKELRRGFLVHIAGDQHLPSTVHYGIDEFEDAGLALCTPAVANLYVRYWNPDYPSLNFQEGMTPFMGRYQDGFHNKITVLAVANPVDKPAPGQFPEPVELHRKATGYGIVRFNKKERTITFEVWPRYVDPARGKQYAGWPITFAQADNYARKPAAWLPTIEVKGMTDPVVKVTDEADGELVYALRIKGSRFEPPVFRNGAYTVEIGEPGTERVKVLKKVASLPKAGEQTIRVDL